MTSPSSTCKQPTWRYVVVAFVISAGVTAVVASAAGGSLGLFVGGLSVIAVVIPSLAPLPRVPSPPSKSDLGTAVSATGGVAGVWAIAAAHSPELSIGDAFTAGACAAALALGLLGILRVFVSAGVNADVASLTTLSIAIAWLWWPVWLSPWLGYVEPAVDWLVRAHPVFAINAVVDALPPWTETPVMYRLTVLGQDVPYRMPGGISVCIAVHLAFGLSAMLTAWRVPLWRKRRAAQPRPNASSVTS